ncbi:MAG: DNA double-strand break repair nuclease NurA [Candidatus Babeliales bacterium]|jgi:hypothetical protein
MLDRNKIAKELEKLSTNIFTYDDKQFNTAYNKWEEITHKPDFKKQVITSKSSFLLPSWQGKLTDVFEIKPELKNYSVLAVDGSQVYPDRHISGINCFLINIGQSHMEYGQPSKANLSSQPYVFTPDNVFGDPSIRFAMQHAATQITQDEREEEPTRGAFDKLRTGGEPLQQVIDFGNFSPDVVDLKREELELEASFKTAHELNQKYLTQNTPFAVLVDGSLIFWQLESKSPEIKKYFLNKYFEHLNSFYEKNIPIAGYISMPKSRELINLLKIGLCRFEIANCISCHSLHSTFPCKDVDHVLDTQIASTFLNQNFRSTIFYSNSKVVDLYPEHLKPCFVYLNIGKEIIRLEFPIWMTQPSHKAMAGTAQKPTYLDLICKIAIDQSIKGQGYPVVLSEAHEQAVIKNYDKDFFYQLICKKGVEQNQRILLSPKSIKKHNVSI